MGKRSRADKPDPLVEENAASEAASEPPKDDLPSEGSSPENEIKTVVPPAKTLGREITVKIWARGASGDPIKNAFVAGLVQQRTVKRTREAWDKLYKNWVSQPR